MIRTAYLYIRLFYHIVTNKKYLSDDLKANGILTAKVAKKGVEFGNYKIEVIGKENIPLEDGILYVANHQAFFDIFASMVIFKRQLAFIAKAKLEKFFYVGTYVLAMGGVLIERDDVKSQVMLIREITERLKNGYNVFIFPEGTRSRTGKLGEFKSGSFKTALKSKASILPITFYDNYEVVKNKGNNVIKVKIDKLITYEEYKDLNTKELADLVKNIISNNLDAGFDRKVAVSVEEL